MDITKILSSHRNDFTADIKCEGCGHTDFLGSGYHDGYYFNHVLPNMKCGICKRSRVEIARESASEASP